MTGNRQAAAAYFKYDPLDIGTIACRGLILDEGGHVIARPLDKFFNLDEHESARLSALPEGPLEVSSASSNGSARHPALGRRRADVLDARLVCVRAGGRATRHLRKRHDLTGLDRDLTLCFEAIYPANRVVLDYGQREELVLLAARRAR